MNATEILIILSSVCFLLFTIRNLKINLCLREYIFSLISMFPCQRVIFEILIFWDCIAWDYILFSKVLDVSEVFWNFTQIETFMCTVTLKGEISNWDAIVYCKTEQFRSKGQITSRVSSEKKHPDCRHRWPYIQLQ